MQNIISVPQLIELCKKYDETWGRWPESEFEGQAVLDFIFEELSPDLEEKDEKRTR